MSRTRIAGLAGLALLALMALAGPGLTGHDPARQNLTSTLLPPFSSGHPLGTDHLGRDLAARLIAGAKFTLVLAALAVASAVATGVGLGILAGWAGGIVDRLLGALADGVLALPGLLLVLLLAAIHPNNWWMLHLGLSLTLWVEFFRLARARTRILAASPAVEAARLMGLGPVVRRHLWPDLAAPILTLSAFGAATVVAALVTLGFISVGLRPPKAEWGVMMAELLPSWREAQWAVLVPIACLAITVACLRLAAGPWKAEA